MLSRISPFSQFYRLTWPNSSLSGRISNSPERKLKCADSSKDNDRQRVIKTSEITLHRKSGRSENNWSPLLLTVYQIRYIISVRHGKKIAPKTFGVA
jgi:hypothetical protein